jgi:hypothetical protein
MTSPACPRRRHVSRLQRGPFCLQYGRCLYSTHRVPRPRAAQESRRRDEVEACSLVHLCRCDRVARRFRVPLGPLAPVLPPRHRHTVASAAACTPCVCKDRAGRLTRKPRPSSGHVRRAVRASRLASLSENLVGGSLGRVRARRLGSRAETRLRLIESEIHWLAPPAVSRNEAESEAESRRGGVRRIDSTSSAINFATSIRVAQRFLQEDCDLDLRRKPSERICVQKASVACDSSREPDES